MRSFNGKSVTGKTVGVASYGEGHWWLYVYESATIPDVKPESLSHKTPFYYTLYFLFSPPFHLRSGLGDS